MSNYVGCIVKVFIKKSQKFMIDHLSILFLFLIYHLYLFNINIIVILDAFLDNFCKFKGNQNLKFLFW
jgi:hypothetical protein